jgi:hypothetical protein
MERFGIMAPDTAATATLEKHGCPYSRPVVHRKMLDIKNCTFTMHAATATWNKHYPFMPTDAIPWIRTKANRSTGAGYFLIEICGKTS